MAGVNIDLMVRGICCLRPGVPGLSENIRVKSISAASSSTRRISASAPARHAVAQGQGLHVLGRLDAAQPRPPRRDSCAPIENATVHEQVLDQIMVANLKDDGQSWVMEPDATYHRRARARIRSSHITIL